MLANNSHLQNMLEEFIFLSKSFNCLAFQETFFLLLPPNGKQPRNLPNYFLRKFLCVYSLYKQKCECCKRSKMLLNSILQIYSKRFKTVREAKFTQNQILTNMWKLSFFPKLMNLKFPLMIFEKCKYYTGEIDQICGVGKQGIY